MGRTNTNRYRTPAVLRPFFKKNGQPKAWLFPWAFASDLGVRPWLRPLDHFRPWRDACARFQPRSSAQRQAQNQLNKAQISTGGLKHVRTLCILATPQTTYLAQLLSHHLHQLGLDCVIQDTFRSDDYDLYIVFSLFVWATLPPAEKRIAFQVEQKVQNQYFTDHYLDQLNASLAVLDYSQVNVTYLRALRPAWLEPDMPLIAHLVYMPIAPLPRMTMPATERRQGVLFYGALTPHRRNVLSRLSQHHDIRIEENLYGTALRDALLTTQVVLNLHRKPDALMETTRICESLSHGAQVVSEDILNRGEFPEIDSMIHFAPPGDIDLLSQAITARLNTSKAPADTIQATKALLENGQHALADLLKEVGVPLPSESPVG